jgi:hypothetical protein
MRECPLTMHYGGRQFEQFLKCLRSYNRQTMSQHRLPMR